MKIQAINKSFGQKQVLKDVSIEFPANKTTVIVGPSGSGKSTILRSLDLLELPDSGIYDFDEQLHFDFSKKISNSEKIAVRKKTGMVFQDYNLFANKNVLENLIEGPTQVLKQKPEIAIKTAKELLQKVGLAGYEEMHPNQLSGGQAQRIAIARALAMQPEFIFLDEPTSALDPELELEVLKVLLQLAKDNQAMVIVTHNLVFARKIADKIVFIEDGKVLYDGDPKQFFAEDNPNMRIKNFISAMTMANL